MSVPADSAAATAEPDWAAGPERLADDIFRVPLPVLIDGLRAVNIYVLRGSDGADLIDAGDAHATTLHDLDRALGHVGVGVTDIRRIYVTHVHPDHYTLAALIRAATGAVVYLGAGERPALEAMERLARGERTPHISGDLERVGAAELRPLLADRLRATVRADVWGRPDHWLTGECTLAAATGELTTLPSPGHTRGHLVYRDTARGLSFTGDHILPHITPSVGFESEPVPSALSDYLRSLTAVLDRPDARLLPAHGPVGDSAHARASELLRHHDVRLASTLGAVRPVGSTPFEVAERLPWTSRGRRFSELEPWHRYLACTETSVHLETLAEHGSVVRATNAVGGQFYEPTGIPYRVG